VTSENPQIQTLLQQINEVLNKTNPRLPWVMSSDAVQQRQVLEQTRDYLLLLQQNGLSETAPATAETSMASSQSAATMEASAQQVLQAVVQEMSYLRSNMMQPLRSDVEMLRMQRDALTQEIRQLEMQRQQYGLPQQNPQYLTEFLQATMAQMQQNLAGQVAQMLAATQSTNPERLAGAQAASLLEGSDAATLSPVERLERLQLIQAQSDQLMLRLDTTLRSVFESLQHNIQSYEDSLEEGLARMHDMGQQGEAVFGAFVTRLGQILGREAASFLQSPQARGDRPSLPGQRNLAEDRPDAQLNRLLEELSALAVPGEPVPFDESAQIGYVTEDETKNLEALDRVLSQLDLSAIPDANLLDTEEFDLVVLSSDQVKTDEELESAIDLLNQITAETATDERGGGNPGVAEQNVEQGTAESMTAEEELEAESLFQPSLVDNPDVLYEDEFYQNLFNQESDQSQSDESESEQFESSQPEVGEELSQADAPVDLDVDLFAGLEELISRDNSLSPAETIDATGLPQSGEERLLQRPQSHSRSMNDRQNDFVTEEELFAALEEELEEEIQEEEIQPEGNQEEIETIAALTDLIAPSSAGSFFAEPPRMLDLGGDYETAQSGEDLFATESTHAPGDLDLPEDSLQQLSADLFDFEERQPDTTIEQEQTDWEQGNWQSSPSVEPVFEGVEWSIADIPSVLLSQPFAGEMTAEDLLFVDELGEFAAGLGDQSDNQGVPETVQSPEQTEDSENPTDAVDDAADNDLLSSTIQDWFSAVEPHPSALSESSHDRSGESSIGETGEPEDNLNAFTLDGLDSLFEGVPSIDAPPPSGTDTQTVTVDNIFDHWNDAPSSQSEQSPLSSEEDGQKKKFRSQE